MVPGFTERDRQAAELRRQDLLRQVARAVPMSASEPFSDGSPSFVAAGRHGLGACLVRVGRRLQGGAELAPVVGEPAVGLLPLR